MESVYLFGDEKSNLRDEDLAIPRALSLSGRFALLRLNDATRTSPRERARPSHQFLSIYTL